MDDFDKIKQVCREAVFMELSLRRIFKHSRYESKIKSVVRDYLNTRIIQIFGEGNIEKNRFWREK